MSNIKQTFVRTQWWCLLGAISTLVASACTAGPFGGGCEKELCRFKGGAIECSPPGATDCEPTGQCCGSPTPSDPPSDPPRLATTPEDSTRVIVDPLLSQSTLTVAGGSPITLAASGVINLRANFYHQEIDRIELGLAPFNMSGSSYRATHLLNNGIIPAYFGEGAFLIPQDNLKLLVNSLVDNQHMWGEFRADEDVYGYYDGTHFGLSATFSDATHTLKFNVAGTAQPFGTDADGDGVLDVSDNCPGIANPSQAKVTAPQLTAPPMLNVSHCSGSVAAMLGQPQVTDTCSSAPVTVTNDAPTTFLPGTTTVTWKATDGAGNVNSAIQYVNLTDTSCAVQTRTVAFQANTKMLWVERLGVGYNQQFGMMPRTVPSIVKLPNDSGFAVAFQANTGNLWVDVNGAGYDQHLGMKAGTSPSIAVRGNGDLVTAFQANTGYLWLDVSGTGQNHHFGMKPGTSPSVAILPNGQIAVAFQADTGNLWLDINGVGYDQHLGMMAGTSPSIGVLPNGQIVVAFQADTGNLWHQINGVGFDQYLGMKAGTSPSVAILSDGMMVSAFQANTGKLWLDIGGIGYDQHLKMMSTASPNLVALANTGYQVAFQGANGNLWLAVKGASGDQYFGMNTP